MTIPLAVLPEALAFNVSLLIEKRASDDAMTDVPSKVLPSIVSAVPDAIEKSNIVASVPHPTQLTKFRFIIGALRGIFPCGNCIVCHIP
jgi:hypothetical protein